MNDDAAKLILDPRQPFAARHAAMHRAIDAAATDPHAREAVLAALPAVSADRDTLFAAAAVLGHEGRPYLESLALQDPDAPHALRKRALLAMLALLPEADRLRPLERARASKIDALVLVAMEELPKLGKNLSPLELRELALDAREEWVAIAVLAAHQLARMPGTASELVALEFLQRREPAVRQAAAQALAAIGTAASLEPLQAAASAKELSRAAPRAIEAIRERLASMRGGLSLAPDEPGRGALSFTADERGRISLSRSTGEGGLSFPETDD